MLRDLAGLQDLLAHLNVQIADLQPGGTRRVLDPDVVVVVDTWPLTPARELVAVTRQTFDVEAGVPLIVLTTMAAADRRTALLDAGADDCLSVPFAATELRARVARLVRLRKRAQALQALYSPEPADDAERLCRREGDYWTIAYRGVTLRLRDCKGLQHLARLLAHPRSEVHALMLTAPPSDGGEDGDRDRRAAASAERARINVTRTIKAAIDAIAAHHPALARHLRAAVRTGTFCCYAPPPGAGGGWLVG